jgi:hypothetical protein
MIGKGRKSRQELSECAVYFETDNWISPITYCCDSGARCSKINAEPHNVYRNVKPTQIHTRNRERSLFVARSNRKLLKIEVLLAWRRRHTPPKASDASATGPTHLRTSAIIVALSATAAFVSCAAALARTQRGSSAVAIDDWYAPAVL